MISAITSIKIYNPVSNPYYSTADESSIEFPITDQCERSAKVMGEDFVRLQFKLKDRVTFDAFSFIEYDNQTFFLREQYIPTPNGTYYTYDVKFVSVSNMLDKHVCYRHVKVTDVGEWYEPEININGTLDTMYVIVMGSIQRAAEQFKDIVYGKLLSTIYANGMASDGINPNYSKVKITANTDLLTFNFSGDNIANVCTTIANNYTNDNKKDTEWYITEEHGTSPDLTQLTLHFAKCQGDESKLQEFSDYIIKDNGAYAFAHPYTTGGLRKVEYAQAWSGITNVIIPYGSDRNMAGQSVKGIDDITKLQSTFGKRLRLEIYDKDGNQKTYNVIDKDGKEQEITINEQGGIRNDFVNTGIEQVKFFDEVYPQAHFQVKEVTTKNKRQDGQIVPEYTIQAVALDNEGKEISTALLPDGFFPLQIEEGTTLSVRFESGLLNGREFEIANKTKSDMVDIDGKEKREYSLIFTIVADGSIEDGTLIPSGNFIPHIGDKFALFNMKMPDVYVELAQQELAQKAYEELVKIQTTRPEVKCSSDPTNFNGQMVLGGIVAVRSELFNSEGNEFKSRIISYSYKLTKTTDVQFSLASVIMQGTLSTMNNLIADVTHTAGGLDQRTINLSRRAWRDATEMAEMLDSLKAEMLLVGEEKFQFAFSSAIQCVHENNAFVGLEVSAGTMQHTQEPYINYSNGGFWGIGYVLLNQDEAGNPLKADTPYYVYAYVEDTEYAEIVINENAYSNEIGKDVPYLMLGILSSEFEGERIFNRTNGFTQITGGTITTEQIQDAGRNLIIDFQSKRIIANDGAEIIGNITFKSPDGGYESAEDTLARLGLVEDSVEEAKQNIAETEQKLNSDLAKAVEELNGGIDALQLQIDGEVSSYFYPYSPINDDESVNVNIEPMSIWLENYNYANGVYTLKAGARNELINNLGDTFTNTETFVDDETTPLAGKSWRWCDATNNTAIKKYITVRYAKDNSVIVKRLHWHIITDTDALRALEAAKNAQATADGKSTTFVGAEPTNYEIGDLWILPSDKTVNGTAYKKGTILTANVASATFDETHWSEDVRYTDDTALENMEIGGTNLLRESKGDSTTHVYAFNNSTDYNYTASVSDSVDYGKEIKISLVKSDNQGSVDVPYANSNTIRIINNDKNVRGSKYTISFNARLLSSSGNKNCKVYFRAAGTSYSTSSMGSVTIDKVKKRYSITVDSNSETDSNEYNYFTLFLDRTTTIYIDHIKLEKGTKATAWSPAPEDVEDSIAKVDSKAQALDYLKKALENDTDVTGGIVATTSIQLRDKTGEKDNAGNDIYKVNAGLSGLDDDNVLMWGGGDYTDAVTAARNSDPESGDGTYKKKDGTEITTLIKKDGTGKIGIYKIDDTKAVVDVPNQGKVIIDASTANGGIFIHDENDIQRIIISPQTISDGGYMPKNVSVLSGIKNGSDSVNGSTSEYTATTTLTLFSKSIDYDGTLNLSTLDISISGINTIVNGNTSMNYTFYTIVDVDVKVKNGTNTTSIGSFSTLKGVTSGSINIPSKEISVQKGTVEIQLVVSSRIVGTELKRSTTCSFSYSSNLSSELVPLYNAKTIICKDGIISAYDSRKYFMVQNTSNGQKIFAKGLSDGADRKAGSGELYVTSSFVDAFVSFLDEFNSYVEMVRTIGGNNKNADNMQSKIETIKNTLVDSSGNRITDIIASS